MTLFVKSHNFFTSFRPNCVIIVHEFFLLMSRKFIIILKMSSSNSRCFFSCDPHLFRQCFLQLRQVFVPNRVTRPMVRRVSTLEGRQTRNIKTPHKHVQVF